MKRTPLPQGCLIKLKNKEIYEIRQLIACGGSSLIYTCHKFSGDEEASAMTETLFVIKECFPFGFERNESYEIVPPANLCTSDEAAEILTISKESLRKEAKITARIYQNSAHAAIPVFAVSDEVEIYRDGWHHVDNFVMIEENLSQKGNPLSRYTSRPLPISASIFLLEQILLNLEEIHEHHFVHCDLSLTNIFIRGSVLEKGVVSLIDFGCAREILDDGYTDVLHGLIMTTTEFAAPEFQPGSRLNESFDLYSAAMIFIRMLTGWDVNPSDWDLEKQIILNDDELNLANVPVHLRQSLNRILSKALDADMANRYQKASDFLRDLREFRKSANFKLELLYDSFDAYITFDESGISLVDKLNRFLSDFDMDDGKNGRRKPRLFSDKGEIAGCYDQTVKEAVDCSHHFLVIYQGDSRYSDWMQQQVQVYRKSKGKKSILVWNLSGEDPDSSAFPRSLRNSQVIPYTGSDLDHPAQKDLLTLTALITGKSLEQITKEHKQKRAKKIAIRAGFSGIAAIICCAVGLPLLHNSRVKARQEEARTACRQAMDAYAEGDIAVAKTLLEDSLDSQDCFVEEQLSALNTLTGAYDTGTYKYHPVNYISSVKNLSFSDEEEQDSFPLTSGGSIEVQYTNAETSAPARDSLGDLFTEKISSFTLINPDGSSKELVSGLTTFQNCDAFETKLNISGNEQTVYLLRNGSCLYAFDESGNIIFNSSFSTEIAGCFTRTDGSILLCLDHGKVMELQNNIEKNVDDSYSVWIDSYLVYSYDGYISDTAYDKDEDLLTLYSNGNLISLSRTADQNMECIPSEKIFPNTNVRIKKVEYVTDASLSCRAVYGYDTDAVNNPIFGYDEDSASLPLSGIFVTNVNYVSIYLPFQANPVIQYKASNGNCIIGVSVSAKDHSVTIDEGPLYSSEVTRSQTVDLGTDQGESSESATDLNSDDLVLTAEKHEGVYNNLAYDTGFEGFELTLSIPDTGLTYAVIENGFYDEVSHEISAISHTYDALYFTHTYSYHELIEKLN